MRQFLKNNAIAIFVSLFSLGGLSFATTIIRPYGPSDYAGGTKAVGSKINTEFDNITNWLNSGNIASGNIAASGVLTSNIADGAVTNPKLASNAVTNVKIADTQITNAKFASANIVTAVSVGTYLNNSATSSNVTGLSVSITTVGRPVLIKLTSSTTGNISYPVPDAVVYGTDSNFTPMGGGLFFIRNSATISSNYVANNGTVPAYTPCSSFSYIDRPAAGTYTYKVAMASSGFGSNVYLKGCALTAMEF